VRRRARASDAVRESRFAIPAGDAALAAVAIATAWAAKAFYSNAGFDALRWILTPTVRLVTWAAGVPFELEPHHGYLSRDQLFLVAPACAGVNFMIVAFVSLCLGLAPACSSAGARAALLLGSAAAAYTATVLANATRLIVSMRLHDAGVTIGPLTPARLHCAVGVADYTLFLLALFAVAERVTGARRGVA